MCACMHFVRMFFVFSSFYGGSGSIGKLSHTASSWASTVMKDDSVSRLSENEPGFDLDEEDVKKFHIWPMGVIPYLIDDFSFDKVLRDRIRMFLERTNILTGLRFMEIARAPEDPKSRWVLFINRQGQIKCAEHSFPNFTNEGVQKVVLGYNCLGAGGELAEIVLLLVGVPPQHNSPDRDNYVVVMTKNILPGKEYLFTKLKNDEWLFHDLKYDFNSAGHFSLHEYTKNGDATIVPHEYIFLIRSKVNKLEKKNLNLFQLVKFEIITNGFEVTLKNTYIGEGKGFSDIDVWKIRMLYNYYIAKRENSKKVPECMKMFTLGSNISNYEPNDDYELRPRKKPNKYLNLPDDVLTKNESKKNHLDDNKHQVSIEGTEEEEVEKTIEKDQENQEKSNSAQNIYEEDKTLLTSQPEKLGHTKKTENGRINDFLQLSDERTDSN